MLAACALAVCLSTQLVSNAMMLLMDRSNFIPEQSSIFFFEPYVISDGSSNDWQYGKDLTYYYHFTYQADAPYLYTAHTPHRRMPARVSTGQTYGRGATWAGEPLVRASARTTDANEKRPLSGAFFCNLERETRLELATSTLARLRSTN